MPKRVSRVGAEKVYLLCVFPMRWHCIALRCLIGSSLELRAGVDVALEGAVVDIGSVVVQEWHDWLVHATVPLHVARFAVPVAVHVLVVLVIDWSLSCAPLAVSIGHRWVARQHSRNRPVEQVRIIDECLGIEGVVVKDNGSIVLETTANAPDDEPHDPAVSKPATHGEALDRQLTNEQKAEENAKLSARSIVCPVEVRLVCRASDHGQVALGEPALQNVEIMHCFRSPLKLTLLKSVL